MFGYNGSSIIALIEKSEDTFARERFAHDGAANNENYLMCNVVYNIKS